VHIFCTEHNNYVINAPVSQSTQLVTLKWCYSQLTMSTQVSALCPSIYNYLRRLRPIVRPLLVEARETVVQVDRHFVFLRLDNCKLQLTVVTCTSFPTAFFSAFKLYRKLTSIRRCEHITLVLRQLHLRPGSTKDNFASTETTTTTPMAASAAAHWMAKLFNEQLVQ